MKTILVRRIENRDVIILGTDKVNYNKEIVLDMHQDISFNSEDKLSIKQ